MSASIPLSVVALVDQFAAELNSYADDLTPRSLAVIVAAQIDAISRALESRGVDREVRIGGLVELLDQHVDAWRMIAEQLDTT